MWILKRNLVSTWNWKNCIKYGVAHAHFLVVDTLINCQRADSFMACNGHDLSRGKVVSGENCVWVGLRQLTRGTQAGHKMRKYVLPKWPLVKPRWLVRHYGILRSLPQTVHIRIQFINILCIGLYRTEVGPRGLGHDPAVPFLLLCPPVFC